MVKRKRTDNEYVNFDPFGGDRDVDIQCHKVSIVTTRKKHWCSAGCLVDNDHNIEAGQRARRERAKVEGQFGTCYQCLPCLDKLMEMNQ